MRKRTAGNSIVGFFLSGLAVTGLAVSCVMEDGAPPAADEEDTLAADTLDDEAVDEEQALGVAYAQAAGCPVGMNCQPAWPPLPPATVPEDNCDPEWTTQYPAATAAEVLLMAAMGATLITDRELDYHPGRHNDMWYRIITTAMGPIAMGNGTKGDILRAEIMADPFGFVARTVAVQLPSNFPAWVNTLTADSPSELVLEKIGHVIERRWLPSTDAPGDEGALFVLAIARELNPSCDGGPEQRAADIALAKTKGDNWSELLRGSATGSGINLQIWNPFKWLAHKVGWAIREIRDSFNKFAEFAQNNPFITCLGAAVAASTVCVRCATAAVAAFPEGGPPAFAAVGLTCGSLCSLIVAGGTKVCARFFD